MTRPGILTINGVEPGTLLEAVPDDWVCPECGAPKDQCSAL